VKSKREVCLPARKSFRRRTDEEGKRVGKRRDYSKNYSYCRKQARVSHQRTNIFHYGTSLELSLQPLGARSVQKNRMKEKRSKY